MSDFDLYDVTDYEAEAQTVGEIIPAGDYVASIVDGELKDTKDGTGKRLNLQWKISEGPCAGRIVFDGVNIINKSDAAQKIGQSHLAAIRAAIAKPMARTIADYCHIPCLIRVKVKTDQQYGDKNEVGSVKAIGGAAPASRPAPVTRATPAANAPTGNAPGFMQRRATV